MRNKITLDRKTILILGTGRSGTTWLAGLLAAPFRYRLLFEPFHPDHVPGAEMVADHYYPPGGVPENALKLIDRAFNDRIDSRWIAQSSNRRFGMQRWRFWPKVRIVKDIRSNLLIPTIHDLLGEEVPIVVLVRHPGAVVESMLRVKFPWTYDLSVLLEQKGFAERYNLPFKMLGNLAVDMVSQMTVRWVIENLYIFRHPGLSGVHLLFYEDLIAEPVKQVSYLCQELGIEVYQNLQAKATKPSSTTHKQTIIGSTESTLKNWRTRLPVNDVAKI